MPDCPQQDPITIDLLSPLPASSVPGFYASWLSAEHREKLTQMSGETDLTQEIQLMRLVIGTLLERLDRSQVAISHAVAVLCRCMSLQIRAGKEAGSLEQVLQDLANSTLEQLESGVSPGLEGPIRSPPEEAARSAPPASQEA